MNEAVVWKKRVYDAGLRRRLQGPAPAVVPGQANQHNYSAHMSVSMALGFLFMAGGQATFSTTPPATAALVIALFPRFPHSPTDHRCHLQVGGPLILQTTDASSASYYSTFQVGCCGSVGEYHLFRLSSSWQPAFLQGLVNQGQHQLFRSSCS